MSTTSSSILVRLTGTPRYRPPMQAQALPRFEYTIRDEAAGALVLADASELSKTCAALAQRRMLPAQRRDHVLDLTQVKVRTDLGTEVDGDTVHNRPDGFHGSLVALGARHGLIPPACPNTRADVESSHATIVRKFFDLETFNRPAHFPATAYQHFFNFARTNSARRRGGRTPARYAAPSQICQPRSPDLLPAAHDFCRPTGSR